MMLRQYKLLYANMNIPLMFSILLINVANGLFCYFRGGPMSAPDSFNSPRQSEEKLPASLEFREDSKLKKFF